MLWMHYMVVLYLLTACARLVEREESSSLEAALSCAVAVLDCMPTSIRDIFSVISSRDS